MAKTKRILMLATDGVEQVELLATHDVLIRGGIDVDIAYSTDQEYIRTSYNIKIKADLQLSKVIGFLDEYQAIVLPGGPGFKKLDELVEMDSILKHFFTEGKLVAAICAAPTILAKRGYLKGKKAICYNDKILRKVLFDNGAIVEDASCDNGNNCEIVQDGNIITGLNMKSSIKFGEKILEYFKKK